MPPAALVSLRATTLAFDAAFGAGCGISGAGGWAGRVVERLRKPGLFPPGVSPFASCRRTPLLPCRHRVSLASLPVGVCGRERAGGGTACIDRWNACTGIHQFANPYPLIYVHAVNGTMQSHPLEKRF